MEVGGKLANRVADVAVQAVTAHKERMTPLHVQTAALVLEQFFDLVSTEIRATTGKLWTPIADHPDTPEWAKDLFGFMARGSGQWQTFLTGNAIGAVMGGGLMDLITNELAPTVHKLVQSNPHAFLSPGDAARAAAMNLWTADEAYGDAAGSGVDRARFDALLEMSYLIPGMADLLDMVNRGLIGIVEARSVLRRAGVHPQFADNVLALRHQELTPDRLAQLVTFGVLQESDATAVAARSGMRPDDFHRLVLGNGEPPGLDQLLFAYRRGVINRDRLFKGVEQGPIRNEWFDVIESFGEIPMTTADAIEAVVKGHLSPDEGATVAHQNGLLPAHWPVLLAAAGNPPGVQEMLSWHNRGLMSRDQLVQGIRESRLNNKYTDLVIGASEALPPMVTIRQLVEHGQITTDQGMRLLEKHGYAPDIATAIIGSALHVKTQKTRDLTADQIVQLYEIRQVSRDDAHTMLTALGYDSIEADDRLDLADLARVRRYVDTVISKLHAGYTKYLVSENEVTAAMDRIGVTPDARTALLTLWDEERQTVTRTLTEAQTIAALKSGLLDEPGTLDRLRGMGYGQTDAQILIDMAVKKGRGTGGG
jgi:hypothetical protein